MKLTTITNVSVDGVMVLKLTVVDPTYVVSPQSVTGSAFVTPRQIKRSRAAVQAFEAALEAARAGS